ncbi:toprim domain-containing protein, partial [bacterium]
MKIISQATRQVYDFSPNGSGENKIPCPECSKDRKKSKLKCFSFNLQKGVGYCNHCLVSFFEYVPQELKKEYTIPEFKNKTNINENSVKWFTGRMISKQTLDRMQIGNAVEFISQVGKERNCICFPYFRNDKLVNVKYRDGEKNFKLSKGSELIFYNLDSVTDRKECIITEGEIDCLSFLEAGFTSVLSVPNGAGSKNPEYLTNCYDELLQVEKIILATDQDVKGIELRDELIRRLGPERCYMVDFNDCKDGNEYLVKYGGLELAEVIKNAIPVPIKDIIKLDDIYDSIYTLYQKGLQPGKKINLDRFDELMTWETGLLAVVTGIPGHGKSCFVDFITTRLNILHGWKTVFFSPENHPIQLLVSKVFCVISGKSFNPKFLSQTEFERVYG